MTSVVPGTSPGRTRSAPATGRVASGPTTVTAANTSGPMMSTSSEKWYSSSSARIGSPSPTAATRVNASGPVRATRIALRMWPLLSRMSAEHEPPAASAATSFVRSPCRKLAASGPSTHTSSHVPATASGAIVPAVIAG